MAEKRGVAVGIDLGTTNSVAAILEGGEPIIVPIEGSGQRTLPSVVAYTAKGVLVGSAAKRQAAVNPKRTFSSIKRKMGTSEILHADARDLTPQQISAEILSKIKAAVAKYTGQEVTDAVITVPAYFDDAQRSATAEAAAIAGINVLRIINEPTAAALAYGIHKSGANTILVFDLGGGTFDVSVLERRNKVLEVKSTSGDTHLGGDDYDMRLMEYFREQFQKKEGIDLFADPRTKAKLKEEAERTKIALSDATDVDVEIPFITADKDLSLNITRAKFEDLTKDLTERCRKPVEQALKDAGLTAADIDTVLLVGGSTRMPAVQQLVKALTGKAVSYKGVNPDEVVAAGAAVQAGLLRGELEEFLLLDVTPLSLGIAVHYAGSKDRVLRTFIERNTTIPTSVVLKGFTTYEDNQPSIHVEVYQGERYLASDNVLLGEFDLEVPPARAGVPEIEITFDIDANGLLSVTAKDCLTGKSRTQEIKGSGRLSEDEIQRMIADRDLHQAEDEVRRDQIQTRAEADELIKETAKNLESYGEVISDGLRDTITRQSQALKDALDSDSTDIKTIHARYDELRASTLKIGDELEAKRAAEAQPEKTEPKPEATKPTPEKPGDDLWGDFGL